MIDTKNLRDVLQACREFGVSQLKTTEFEIKMSDSVVSIPAPITQAATTQELPAETKDAVKELQSLMKLDDQSLVDRLFPAAEDTGEII
jgi:hypothetical protein